MTELCLHSCLYNLNLERAYMENIDLTLYPTICAKNHWKILTTTFPIFSITVDLSEMITVSLFCQVWWLDWWIWRYNPLEVLDDNIQHCSWPVRDTHSSLVFHSWGSDRWIMRYNRLKILDVHYSNIGNSSPIIHCECSNIAMETADPNFCPAFFRLNFVNSIECEQWDSG